LAVGLLPYEIPPSSAHNTWIVEGLDEKSIEKKTIILDRGDWRKKASNGEDHFFQPPFNKAPSLFGGPASDPVSLLQVHLDSNPHKFSS